MTLPKEIIERIQNDSVKWSECQYGHSEGCGDYTEGALHEAERAKVLVDALELAKASISSLIRPVLWNQQLSDETRHLLKTRNAIEEAISSYNKIKDGQA